MHDTSLTSRIRPTTLVYDIFLVQSDVNICQRVEMVSGLPRRHDNNDNETPPAALPFEESFLKTPKAAFLPQDV